LDSYEVITFDCYGTLIDWETGIRRSFVDALARTRANTNLGSIFNLFAAEERRLENETPHLLYKDVLTRAALAVAQKAGWNLPEGQGSFLADDLPAWLPFPDTNPALESLAREHSLGILSNVDNDLLSGTLTNIKTPFEMLVTAENVRSYKPRHAHFEEARRRIGTRRWLHVAASRYHDIEPAVELGIDAIWVNRKNLAHSETRVPIVRNLTEIANQFS
jgi:2-haloalkanoic acid dehalogenase type II